MASQKRVESVDFWRGLVLVAILFEHVPGNILEYTTQRNFGFSDCAEVFVFLSGVSVSLVYYKKIVQSDIFGVIKRCFNRAIRIYGVHIALTCAGVAIFGLAYSLNALPNFVEDDGRIFVFHKPLRGLLGILMLSQQLGYLNILPIYVVLMMWSPFALAIARLNTVLALSVSLAIYVVARLTNLSLPTWPEPGTWFLNPFTWQLVFTIGIVAGIKWARTGVPRSPVLLFASTVIVLFGFAVVSNDLGFSPGLRESAFVKLDLLKQNLGWARLLHFLALAYIVSQLPVFAKLARTTIGREFQRLGRHSLAIFAFGTLLSCTGQAVLRLADTQINDGVEWIGMLYTLFGVAGLFLLARYLEWQKRGAIQSSPQPSDASGDSRQPSTVPSPSLSL
jgi:hypothetical protein